MRVMLMIKGDPEPGATPSEELLTAMGRYNKELQQAGGILAHLMRLPRLGVTKVQLHAVGVVETAPAEAALGLKPR